MGIIACMPRHSWSAASVACLWLLGCDPSGDGDDDGDDDETADAASGVGDPSEAGGAGDPELPPTEAGPLEAWLADGTYLAWAAESAVHGTSGPHGDGVRTFVNTSTLDAFAADATVFPAGAALVKELYSGDALDGWAVMVKVAEGEGGATWYWYERLGASVYADGTDEALCTGCHASGRDFVRTPYPLQ